MARLNCRLDRELDKAITHFAKANGLTRSQAARELLRQAATSMEPCDRGWWEGFNKGYAETQKATHAALSDAIQASDG